MSRATRYTSRNSTITITDDEGAEITLPLDGEGVTVEPYRSPVSIPADPEPQTLGEQLRDIGMNMSEEYRQRIAEAMEG